MRNIYLTWMNEAPSGSRYSEWLLENAKSFSIEELEYEVNQASPRAFLYKDDIYDIMKQMKNEQLIKLWMEE